MGCEVSAISSSDSSEQNFPQRDFPKLLQSYIKVCGTNDYSQLCVNSNRSTQYERCVCPPLIANIDMSEVISFTIYQSCCIYVTKNGKAFKKGFCRFYSNRSNNSNYKNEEEEIIVYKDQNENSSQYKFLSAVCGYDYALLLTDDDNVLVYMNNDIEGNPIFIKLDEKPVSIFGGSDNSAVIDSKGNAYLIDKSIIETKAPIKCNIKEPCKNVACCREFYCVLTKNGSVYWNNKIDQNESGFIKCPSLQGIVIKQISGVFDSCVAISNEGSAYSFGTGIKNDSKQFVKLDIFEDQRIINASTGREHSLFVTGKGSILCYGKNDSGNLFTDDINEEEVKTPVEISFSNGDFIRNVIAGDRLSVAFVNMSIPPNSPNLNMNYN